MATSSKIVILKGNPFIETLNITNSDGSVYDLTGKTVMFTVKEIDDSTDTDSVALITVDITSHSDPTNGVTILEVPTADTLIAVGFYKWDLRIYEADSSGAVEPLVQVNSETGSCEVKDIVTKRIG